MAATLRIILEQVWARDSVLNLIQHFIQDVEEADDKGKKTDSG